MLVLHLLGPTRILFDDVPLTDLPAGKNLALLAYLALERWPHARERLAALLWGDMPAARAQSNLRMALYTLNNLLPEVLESGRTTVALTADLPVKVDALALQTLAHKPEATLEELEAAVALWQGEFLHDLTLSGAVLFDEWLGPTRERIRLALFAVSERLAWAWVRSGEPMRAVPHLYRWLEIEPWHETAHRTLMFALARAGRYTEALAQYKTCVLALDRELGVPPMPETSRLAEQIQLARGLASRDNLPQVLTPLVGRASEQRQLQRLLLDPSTRLVTLVGLGGMGKTRLALHIAATLRHAFLHGVWYVALEGCTDAPGLLAAVATALNVPLTGAAPLDTTLLAALQGRELLVILDGFEGVHEHALLLNEWLRAVQGLTLLVTSRQRLALRGETVFVLEGLDPEAAGALFCACVERLKPGYDPRLDQGALEALIRLTGGMPLALELAAAWIERYSLPEIVVQVAQDSEVLSGVYRDLPAKQLSLRAIIAFAWHLLTPGAQQVLAQLAVLRGHFDEEQAAVVSGARPEVVTLLLHHALLQRPTASTFAIHELVRQFALHELAAQPTLHAQAHAAHLAHFGAMLGTQNRLLSGGETTGGALQCLAANFDNLRSAWEHACTQPEERWLEAAAEPIHKFCEGQGRYAEG
ncbi:MAG: hypothetical protein EOM24_01900, partial [Chloroflexia bacterium]|nr:hypothetical protein [Chloroflexia bacterium]